MSGLLAGERARRGTRRGRRALGCYRQAIMVLRWFLDGTRVAQLALDNQVSGSTAYLHDAIVVLAAAAPSLHGALPAARTAGYSHVLIIDDSALVAGGLCVLGVYPPLILLMAAALAATDETELQRAGSRRR